MSHTLPLYGGENDTEGDFVSGDGTTTESEAESEWFTPEISTASPLPLHLRILAKLIRRPDVSGARRSPEVERGTYKIYRWRWFMLATLSFLNISNGMMWLTFAPIPNYTALFYNVSLDQVDWFSISYFVVSLLTGFIAIAILDVFGLRASLYLGAGFNLTGSLFRWLSTAGGIVCSPHHPLSGYLVAMVGQSLTACAQPFLLYAPTKLASYWFGPKERAFCTMLASLGNPVGLAAAQLISPYVVTSLDRFSILHVIYTVPAFLGAILAVVAFWRNKPSIPPAPSAQRDPTPFLMGLRQTLTTPSFLFLLGIWGCSSGIFNALLTLLAQILCPFGYSDKKSGLWGSLLIFSGLVGATCAGLIIDHFKLFKEVAVVFFSLGMLSFIWFVEVFSLSEQSVNIAFSLCAFGFFAFPLIPACMELGVEITYPASEATSSGLLWSATQVMGIVLVLIGQTVQTDLPGDLSGRSACSVGDPVSNSTLFHCFNSTHFEIEIEDNPKDLTNALLIYASIGVLSLLTMVILFRPKYKRLEMEARAAGILTQLHTEVVSPSSVASLPTTRRDDNIFKMAKDKRDPHQTSTAM